MNIEELKHHIMRQFKSDGEAILTLMIKDDTRDELYEHIRVFWFVEYELAMTVTTKPHFQLLFERRNEPPRDAIFIHKAEKWNHFVKESVKIKDRSLIFEYEVFNVRKDDDYGFTIISNEGDGRRLVVGLTYDIATRSFLKDEAHRDRLSPRFIDFVGSLNTLKLTSFNKRIEHIIDKDFIDKLVLHLESAGLSPIEAERIKNIFLDAKNQKLKVSPLAHIARNLLLESGREY